MKSVRYMFPRLKSLTTATSITVAALSVLPGCGSMSGYDAGSEFNCKAPDGVQCQSMSGVYANRKNGASSSNSSKTTSSGSKKNHGEIVPYSQLGTPAARNMGNGQPPTYFGAIRSEPTTLRTWVMAYRDTDGDIVDQLYLYMTRDSGHWMLEHNEQTIRDNFSPKSPSRSSIQPNLGLKKESAARGAVEQPIAETSAYGLERDTPADNASGTKQSGETAAMIRQLQESMKGSSQAAKSQD